MGCDWTTSIHECPSTLIHSMMIHPPNPTTTTTRPPNQCRVVPLLCRSYGPSPRPRPSSPRPPPGRQKPPARHEQPGAGRQSPLPLTKPTSAAERETYSLALRPRDQLPGRCRHRTSPGRDRKRKVVSSQATDADARNLGVFPTGTAKQLKFVDVRMFRLLYSQAGARRYGRTRKIG